MTGNITHYDGVVLVSPVSLGYSKTSEHSARWFIGSVLRELIQQAGLKKDDIDGLAVSSFTLQPDTVSFLSQYYEMTLRWLEQLPFGGASGVIALRRAARAVQSGDAEVIACIGGDTANARSFKELAGNFSTFSNSSVYPYGGAGPNAPFALITRHYMKKYGITREEFGRMCVAQRYNANHYAPALLGHKTLTLDDYMNARVIADPLHLLDCVMPCAGAEGFLVMTRDRAMDLGLSCVSIKSADELHHSWRDATVQFEGGWSVFKDRLYESAGLNPEDIDLVQTYDDYPVISVMQLSNLGLLDPGQLKQFLDETSLTFDGGGLPHNTSGGQLSGGQAGSAAGYLGVVESIRQVTGTAKANQVPEARTAMVSGYGMINYDRGLCSVAAILQRGE